MTMASSVPRHAHSNRTISRRGDGLADAIEAVRREYRWREARARYSLAHSRLNTDPEDERRRREFDAAWRDLEIAALETQQETRNAE